MNRERRRDIINIAQELEKFTWQIGEGGELYEALYGAKYEEEEARDNMPESLQNGAKGEAAETAIDALAEAADTFEELFWKIEEAIAKLKEAAA